MAPKNQEREGASFFSPGENTGFWRRYGDWIIAATLFTATIISRIPFRSRSLYIDDSTGFALALDDFDLAQQRPHPPGYILYIAAGRVFHFFFGDANTALVALSIFSAAVAVAAVYFLGKAIFGRAEGLAAALLLFFSPLLWLYSEVALTYAVAVPLAMLITWLLYQVFFHRSYAIICGLVMGLAAGVRQDLLLFFAPVFLVAVFRVRWRRMFLAFAAVAAGVLIWLAPLVVSVGDLGQFIEIQSRQYGDAVLPYSFFEKGTEALIVNGKEILKASIWLLGPSLLMLPVIMAQALRGDRKVLFLLFTVVPALAAFLLFFIDPPAYLLICAPAFSILAARGIAIVARWAAGVIGEARLPFLRYPAIKQPVVAAALVMLSAWVSLTLFLSGSQTLDRILPGTPGYEFLFITHNANGIKARDESLQAALDEVRRYEPQSTLVVCNIADNVFNWTRLMYYLPDYRVIGIHLLDGIEDGAFKDGRNHVEKTRGGGVIELGPMVERVIFIGQEIADGDYLDFSGNVDAEKDSLIRPDRFAPSVVAIVDPVDESFRLGLYTFER